MKEDIQQATYQGVRDAKKKDERDYRDPADVGMEVSRGGTVRMDGDYPEIDRFPHMIIAADDGLYRANVPAAVALAWTTPEERAEIRAKVPLGAHHSSDEVMAVVSEINVWKHAVAEIARTDKDSLAILDDVPVTSWAGKDVRRLEDVKVDDYGAKLQEAYRPPSKGGNTTALHRHSFTVDGEWYSFFGRGSKRFIFKEDLATFDYVMTDDGYRNVIRSSIITKNAKGKIVPRGIPGDKKKLRTAPARAPGSRREMRD
jgi:hypothetical protein